MRGLLTPAAENTGEDIAESAATSPAAGGACSFGEVVVVESVEVEGNFLGVGMRATCIREGSAAAPARASAAGVGFRRRRINVVGVETELIVDLALLGIAEDVVGL